MDFESVTATSAIDIFLLLLIGIGPKIALVPFLEATAGMPAATKAAWSGRCSRPRHRWRCCCSSWAAC